MNYLQIQLSEQTLLFIPSTHIELGTGYKEVNTELWSLPSGDHNSVEVCIINNNQKRRKAKRNI